MALIGFGKPKAEDSGSTDEIVEGERQKWLWLSIFFAIICGLSFALNSFVMKHYVKKFDFSVI